MQWNTGYEGSYGMNGWLYSEEGSLGAGDADKHFTKESQFDQPVKNPILSDCAWADGWPLATDTPARDLLADQSGSMMARFCIGRHGSVSRPPPRRIAKGAPLPGSVHMVFIDGHVDGVRLENL